MSDDIKVDVKQQEMQELVLLSCKYNEPSDMICFSLNFAWDSIQPGLVHLEKGGRGGGRGSGFLLNGQNLLSMTKVIC